MATTILTKALRHSAIFACLICFGCTPEKQATDYCYIRIGDDYCLRKDTNIEVANFSHHGAYSQILRFPRFSGGVGEIEITYDETSTAIKCELEENNVIATYRNIKAKCLDCKSGFEEQPSSFAGEIITQDDQTIFKPCHDLFSREADNDQ